MSTNHTTTTTRRAFLASVALAVPASTVAVSSAAAMLAPAVETLPTALLPGAPAVPNPDADLLGLADKFLQWTRN